MRWLLFPALALTGLVASPASAEPEFDAGFGQLKAQLGDTMGDATTDELPSDDGGTIQMTTTGLAHWAPSRGVEFTDGANTWHLYVPPVSSAAPRSTGTATSGAIPASIVRCESGGNRTARNPSGAYGLYQLTPSTYANTPPGRRGVPISQGQDEAAAWLYATQRTAPWASSRECWGGR